MRILLLLLLLCCPLWGFALKEQFQSAPVGSYVVLEQNKNYTFLYIRENDGTSLVMDEISIPAKRFAREKCSWRAWFAKGAPSHSAWLTLTLDLFQGSVQEAYSHTQGGYLEFSEASPFLTTLLNLDFAPVADNKRRRIGPGKTQARPFWNPRLVVDGQLVRNVQFTAWTTRWPEDGGELSRKKIEVYFPESNSKWPTYFPYWLEVEGNLGSAKARIIDSGVNL